MIALNDSRESQRFEVGTLVQHRRYGYRGVVVAVDDVCRADEAWYQKNQHSPTGINRGTTSWCMERRRSRTPPARI